jgi:hypothetical protein
MANLDRLKIIILLALILAIAAPALSADNKVDSHSANSILQELGFQESIEKMGWISRISYYWNSTPSEKCLR